MSRKHALVIGLDYNGELPGCINDANRMEAWLLSQGYTVYKIIGASGTLAHIQWALMWVCGMAWVGWFDDLFIHYAGHGTRVPDYSGDEEDFKDEAIVTHDGWAILDDQFHYLLRWIPPQTNLKILMDCCHSGTAMDLEYRWYPEANIHKRAPAPCVSLPGNIQMISGCMDDQAAAEVTVQGQAAGAMTLAFLQHATLQWTPELPRTMTQVLRAAGLPQRPVYSSTREIPDTTTEHE